MTTGAGGGDATPDVAVTITQLSTDTEVEPGTVASWEVQVRNLRTTRAVYVLDVLGEAAGWSRISRASSTFPVAPRPRRSSSCECHGPAARSPAQATSR